MSVTLLVCPLKVRTILLVSVSTMYMTKLSQDTANMQLWRERGEGEKREESSVLLAQNHSVKVYCCISFVLCYLSLW